MKGCTEAPPHKMSILPKPCACNALIPGSYILQQLKQQQQFAMVYVLTFILSLRQNSIQSGIIYGVLLKSEITVYNLKIKLLTLEMLIY
jgi:hypothetical protein